MTHTVISSFTTAFVMSAILLIILLLNRLFPNALPARQRYIIWLVALAGILIPFRPVMGSGIVQIPLPALMQEWAGSFEGTAVTGPDTTAESAQPAAESSSKDQADMPINGNSSYEEPQLPFGIRPFTLFMLLWGSISVILFSVQLWRYFRFIRMVKRWGVPVSDEKVLSLFRTIQSHMGIGSKRIDLRVCSFVSSSMLTGFIHPVILLPENHFDEDELDLIFRHELIHLKRHDLAVKLLTVTATCLHWFNPFVYWLCAELQTDGEITCDEAVLKDAGTESRRFYGEVIIGMIGKKDVVKTKFSTCFYGGKSNIKRRLASIMNTNKKIKRPYMIAIIAVAILTLSSGSVLAFSQNKPDTATPAATASSNTDITDTAATAEISVEDAKAVALTKAGGGTVTQWETDYENGRKVYEIEIIKEDVKYEIDVDAVNSAIVRYKTETLSSSAATNDNSQNTASAAADTAAPDVNKAAADTASSDGNKAVPSDTSEITAEEAKQIALAKVGSGEIMQCKLDYENGRKVYEIDIVEGNKKYEIDVDALNSAIVKYEVETLAASSVGNSQGSTHYYDDDDYDDDYDHDDDYDD